MAVRGRPDPRPNHNRPSSLRQASCPRHSTRLAAPHTRLPNLPLLRSSCQLSSPRCSAYDCALGPR
eukprot:scaffold224546_cov23-Tisochrysis_lutea.AAC.1